MEDSSHQDSEEVSIERVVIESGVADPHRRGEFIEGKGTYSTSTEFATPSEFASLLLDLLEFQMPQSKSSYTLKIHIDFL